MLAAPFDYKRTRERYPGDGTIATTIRVTAFYRSVEFTYTRPMTPSEQIPPMLVDLELSGRQLEERMRSADIWSDRAERQRLFINHRCVVCGHPEGDHERVEYGLWTCDHDDCEDNVLLCRAGE